MISWAGSGLSTLRNWRTLEQQDSNVSHGRTLQVVSKNRAWKLAVARHSARRSKRTESSFLRLFTLFPQKRLRLGFTGFSCVICITTDTKGTERQKMGIMQYPKGLMLRKKRPAKRYQRRGHGEVGRFILFFQLYCMRLASQRTLMGAVDKARGGHATPYPLMSPISFVLELFLHLSVSAGVGHTTTGRRDGTAKNGARRPRGNYKYYLPLLPSWHFKLLSAFADIATNLYFLHPLASLFSPSFLFSPAVCLA